MDERRLRYFLAVADNGTVTGAAATLHIAQPSLSQALRAFEQELGVELFHRVGRGLQLSPAGEALVGPARATLRAMDSSRRAVSEIRDVLSGRLDITALATLALDPLAALLGRFRGDYPGIIVRLTEAEDAAHAIRLVDDGACELGIAHLPITQSRLVTHDLGIQELLFVLPPGSQVGTPRPLDPAALAEVPLVVSPSGTSTRTLLDQALAAVDVIPRIAVETSAREAIVPLVLAGAGAALLPAALAQDAERRGAVVRPARPSITRRIGLIHRTGSLSPAATVLIKLATDELPRPGRGGST